MLNRLRKRIVCSIVLAVAGCAQPVPKTDELSTPPLPTASYMAAARSGSAVYRINPHESLVLLHVTRAGAMKNLGHDHAIASVDLQGFVEIGADSTSSRADLAIPLRNLVVDNPVHRGKLSLDTEVSESDIAGTYSNMLKVLQPELDPWTTVHATVTSRESTSATLALTVTVQGKRADYLLPVEMQVTPKRLSARGRLTVRHSDFGLAPFSAAGGMLRVADEVLLEFSLTGEAL